MCEYSLEAERSVKAKIGETYKLAPVGLSGHPAFVTDDSCTTAACMSDGTRLRIEGISLAIQGHFRIPASAEVVMERLNARDYVRFPDGERVHLTQLMADGSRGVRGTVLMPAAAKAPEDVDLAGPPPPQYTGTPVRVSLSNLARTLATLR